uniref:Photosystem I reaction center subunit PsaK n=1 Tax=Lympha mucosa TaxID=2045360 RepID=A0A6B9VT04_9FLOR|nr:photosystem I reaction center subunit X [Lympha mucosa]
MNIDNIIANTNISTTWSMQIALVMIICNVIAIIIGRYGIQVRNTAISIPILNIIDLSLTELLATTSLGHIIGAGTILGLRSINLIN